MAVRRRSDRTVTATSGRRGGRLIRRRRPTQSDAGAYDPLRSHPTLASIHPSGGLRLCTAGRRFPQDLYVQEKVPYGRMRIFISPNPVKWYRADPDRPGGNQMRFEADARTSLEDCGPSVGLSGSRTISPMRPGDASRHPMRTRDRQECRDLPAGPRSAR